MKYYFRLQYMRMQRWLSHAGIHPLAGLMIGILSFIGLSGLLFYKTDIAHWIYLAIAVSLLFSINTRNRSRLLMNIFSAREYYLLRILENLLVVLPFQSYLWYEGAFSSLLLLFPIAIALSFVKPGYHFNKTVITPFKRFPFEFIVGFRRTFGLVIFGYFLIIKAMQVDNYNLGLFALGLFFLISMLYYLKPEPEYFVWIYSQETGQFLTKKFITAVICVSILSFLGLMGILIAFPSMWLTTLLVYLAGYIVLGSMVVAKYASYPHEMSVPQGVFYALSLMFPPLLLLAIWIFYAKSKKRLEPILEC